MDDVIKLLRDQSAAAEQISAQFRPMDTVSAGMDGAVAVVMNFDGAVIRCWIHPHWRRRLTQGDLGTAVMCAIQEGYRMTLERPAAPDSQPSTEPAHSTPAEPADPAQFASYLRTLLIEVQNSLPAIAEQVLSAANEVSTVEGAGGAVVAMIRSGALVRLDIKPTWLRRTGHAEIGRVLTEVLAQALPGSMQRMIADLDAVGRVAEFRAVMADPARLLANLGLGLDGVR